MKEATAAKWVERGTRIALTGIETELSFDLIAHIRSGDPLILTALTAQSLAVIATGGTLLYHMARNWTESTRKNN